MPASASVAMGSGVEKPSTTTSLIDLLRVDAVVVAHGSAAIATTAPTTNLTASVDAATAIIVPLREGSGGDNENNNTGTTTTTATTAWYNVPASRLYKPKGARAVFGGQLLAHAVST